MLRMTALLTVALALAAPAAATAGVAQTRTYVDRFLDVPVTQVTYTAAAGERNVVSVDSLAHGEWGIRDTGAAMTAGPGCVAVNAHAIRCTTQTTTVGGVEVTAGGGADSVTIAAGLSGVVRGGGGDDVLRGAGRLAGEAGNDTIATNATNGRRGNDLSGGSGRDVLRGGSGVDRLDGGAGDDRIDGGGGRDSLVYRERRSAVTVDLSAHRGGGRGERDVLRRVESVVGGEGDDVLRGDGARNALAGGAGEDRLDGRGGGDTLDGGAGADRLLGGGGDDKLLAKTPGDRARGGPGDDELDGLLCCGARAGVSLDGGSGDDVLALNARPVALACGTGHDVVRVGSARAPGLARAAMAPCERVRLSMLTIAAAPRRAGATLRLPASCSARAGQGCHGAVTLRTRDPRGRRIALGRVRYAIAGGRRSTLRFALDAADRRRLAGAADPRIEVDVRWGDVALSGYPQWRERWLVRPRAPARPASGARRARSRARCRGCR